MKLDALKLLNTNKVALKMVELMLEETKGVANPIRHFMEYLPEALNQTGFKEEDVYTHLLDK